MNKTIFLMFRRVGIPFLALLIIGISFSSRREANSAYLSSSVDVYFNPSEITVDTLSTDQTYDVYITTNDYQVTAAVIEVRFDPKKLELTDISPGEELPIELTSALSSNTASITVGCQPSSPFSGTGKVATISFNAGSSPTIATLTFTANTQAAAADYTGDVLGTKTPGTIIIGPVGPPAIRIYVPVLIK